MKTPPCRPDGPSNDELEPYLGKTVKIAIEVTGRFERFYGDEIIVAGHQGTTRYVKKRDISEIEELKS